MSIVAAWSRAFSLTLVIELVVAIPLLAGLAGRLRRAQAVCFAQVLTHPAVWFIIPDFGWPRPAYLVAAETWAIGGEFLFYRFVFPEMSGSRALAASALANAASYSIGAWLGA